MSKITMDKLVTLCKSKGYIFAGSEIYGGLANTWDYGPLGVEFKNNIKKAWWQMFVQENDNSHGIDSAILMNPKVWEASGHLASFSDPLMDCKSCKTRHRADTLVEAYLNKKGKEESVEGWSHEQLKNFIVENNIACPNCGKRDFTDIREFNLMFETNRGVTKDSKNIIYLRPETAQGEYVNFLNIQKHLRLKLPFGIGQIGKAFRNEITPGNFTFRTIEFEQMEHQLFCKKGEDEKFYEEYKQKAMEFFTSVGLKAENLRFKDHDKLAHYAKAACDVEFLFPFGWGEINGTHNRTDYDLKRHQEYSKKSLEYVDPITQEKFIPYVVESTYGPERLFLALLIDAYHTEEVNGEERVVLKLKPSLAPYKVAILPLQKKLSEKAIKLKKQLSKSFMTTYDQAGSIGKRYRRQDEIGTPFCITVDFETLEDDAVTVRDRDTMEQERIKIEDVKSYIANKLED